MRSLCTALKAAFGIVVIANTLTVNTTPAFGQRPTRIYGSAYQVPISSGYVAWSYRCHVAVWAEDGNYWNECDTNWIGDWWLDNVPSNRWYLIQARAKFAPSLYSDVLRVWVPERPWWQVNQTRIPTLWCRYPNP
jgi:hypothetical protein